MRRLFTFTLCCIAALSLVSCGNRQAKAEQEAEAAQALADSLAQIKEQTIMDKLANLPAEPVFDIVTNYGTMRVKLYEKTPKHRDNFAKLALNGFYDGILFHRVINGFMIQTGDPLTKDPDQAAAYGTGGPGYTIDAEFVPEYTHKKGALAAARRGDAANPLKESSGSQFYIVQDEFACAQLDGQYTVFGETLDGIKTIDKIASVETTYRDRPVEDVRIISIKLVENQ